MKIRIAGTEYSLNNQSYEIYVQGCYRNCNGCHNPDTHNFCGGKEYDIQDFIEETYHKIKPFIEIGMIKNLYVSGGDLLCQEQEVAERFSDSLDFWFGSLVRLWLFTGAGEDESIPDWVWEHYDVVKMGMYREDLRNPDGTFPASSNQKLIGNSSKMTKEEFDDIQFEGEKIWK